MSLKYHIMQFLKTNLQKCSGDLNKKFLKETKKSSIVMVNNAIEWEVVIMFLPWVWVFLKKKL